MLRSILSLRAVFYFAYGVILLAVLLYVRFPAAKFKLYCEKSVEHVLLGSECTIGRMYYRFPGTIGLEDIRLSGTSAEDGKSEVVIDNLEFFFREPIFWRELLLVGEGYDGEFTLLLDFDLSDRRIVLRDIQMKNMNVSELTSSFKVSERKMTGLVSYSGSYQAPIDNIFGGGEGEGKITVAQGSIELLQPVLSLSVIDFQQMAFDVKFSKWNFIFQGGELKGTDLAADFSGTFDGGDTLFHNSLNISGHISPQAAFLAAHPREQKMVYGLLKRYRTEALPFKVGGSLSSPTLRFSM